MKYIQFWLWAVFGSDYTYIVLSSDLKQISEKLFHESLLNRNT